MSDVLQAVAGGEDQPAAAYRALEALADSMIGVKLFTVTELEWKRGVARRTYTNMPEAYPKSGEKEILEDAWTDRVLNERQFFVANSIEEIAEVFFDHPLIQSLGCESCMNIPVAVGGKVRATVNCLHEAGHFTPERVKRAQTLIEPATLAVAAAMYLQAETRQ